MYVCLFALGENCGNEYVSLYALGEKLWVCKSFYIKLYVYLSLPYLSPIQVNVNCLPWLFYGKSFWWGQKKFLKQQSW